MNSKLHIDRRGAEINMIQFTIQQHFVYRSIIQQLFYHKINVSYAYPAILDK